MAAKGDVEAQIYLDTGVGKKSMRDIAEKGGKQALIKSSDRGCPVAQFILPLIRTNPDDEECGRNEIAVLYA
jgi:hypothetical protein